jgi:serine/threonine-protein kinase
VSAPVAAPPAPAPEKKPAAKKPPSTINPDELIGVTLNGRYQVEKKLGQGGFGAVFMAVQAQMKRKVALKVLHPKMAEDPQVVGRFKREAQASSLLRAAHTVQVYDFDQTPDGMLYLAMEMLEGKSLHDVLKEEGPLDPYRLLRILDEICDSLDEAHQVGIVHRDIKPENIYLEPRPRPDFVKVLDFGIAKIVTGDGMSVGPALTGVGQTLGTLEYMSPEQLQGIQLDGRTDLYALGILAYEMLTGRLPFDAKTPGDMITAHFRTVPKPPSKMVPDRNIPDAVDRVVLKMLEKNRDNRFKSAADLKQYIAQVLGEAAQVAAAANAPTHESSIAHDTLVDEKVPPEAAAVVGAQSKPAVNHSASTLRTPQVAQKAGAAPRQPKSVERTDRIRPKGEGKGLLFFVVGVLICALLLLGTVVYLALQRQ